MTTTTTGPAAIPPLEPQLAARLGEFARACKAAARAVALYPPSHPAIGTSLGRLASATGKLTETGPCRLQVRPDLLLIDGAAAARGDGAISELAGVLYRHLIGGLTVNAGADADSWRTLLLLLARSPEDVRADGGIAHLWATAGGPSLEIEEIDYAEVLRERQGAAATIERPSRRRWPGRSCNWTTRRCALVEIVGDPAKLQALMDRLESETAGQGRTSPRPRSSAFCGGWPSTSRGRLRRRSTRSAARWAAPPDGCRPRACCSCSRSGPARTPTGADSTSRAPWSTA
jgi:hypothetical protein